jgi:hypothetical protein
VLLPHRPEVFLRRVAAFALTLSGLLCACYDHRFTQAIIENRRRAREAEGAEIHAARSGPAKGGIRVARVRFHVAKGFREQHREWRHTLSALLDAANGIAKPGFQVQFEMAAAVEWEPKCDHAHLDVCLAEIVKLEAGEDGDWVVGVLGAAASFTTSFEQLGMAQSVSRHFVVRDVSDLAERAAIDQGFASLTPARRDEIYKRRKTHKRLAVFLHEWGHTLGALHVSSAKSLLNPFYDDSMEQFDEGNLGLIDASLRDVFRYAGTHDELKAYLRSSAGAQLPAEERNALLAQLEGSLPNTPAGVQSGASARVMPEHAFLVQGKEDVLLAGLEPQERDAYLQAATSVAAGDYMAGLATAKPLAEKHPDNYAVQHLVCSLAMQLGQQSTAERACPRALSGAGAGK